MHFLFHSNFALYGLLRFSGIFFCSVALVYDQLTLSGNPTPQLLHNINIRQKRIEKRAAGDDLTAAGCGPDIPIEDTNTTMKVLKRLGTLMRYTVAYAAITHCTFEYIGDFVLVSGSQALQIVL